jgi:hypothetical protein
LGTILKLTGFGGGGGDGRAVIQSSSFPDRRTGPLSDGFPRRMFAYEICQLYNAFMTKLWRWGVGESLHTAAGSPLSFVYCVVPDNQEILLLISPCYFFSIFELLLFPFDFDFDFDIDLNFNFNFLFGFFFRFSYFSEFLPNWWYDAFMTEVWQWGVGESLHFTAGGPPC